MEYVTATVRKDHNRILSGLDDSLEWGWTADAGARNRPLELLFQHLQMHTYGEEEVPYPLLRDAASDQVEQAAQEHAGIHRQLEDLLHCWRDEPAWRSHLQRLKRDFPDPRGGSAFCCPAWKRSSAETNS